MEQIITLYDKIYMTACTSRGKGGKEFSFSKTAFDSILYKNPNIIDVEEFFYDGISPEDSFTIMYLRLLNRLPDVVAKKRFSALVYKRNKNPQRINYYALRAILFSTDFKKMSKRVEGLKSLESRLIKNGTLSRLRIIKVIVSQLVKNFIKEYFVKPIWNCFPDIYKMKIKHLFKKEI